MLAYLCDGYVVTEFDAFDDALDHLPLVFSELASEAHSRPYNDNDGHGPPHKYPLPEGEG